MSPQRETNALDLRRTREALSFVCENWQALREELCEEQAPLAPDTSEPLVLAAVSTSVRTGGDYMRALEDLHVFLRESGDPHGLYGRLGGGTRGVHLAGVTIGAPAEDDLVYVCPTDRCGRLVGATPRIPRCALTGEELLEDSL